MKLKIIKIVCLLIPLFYLVSCPAPTTFALRLFPLKSFALLLKGYQAIKPFVGIVGSLGVELESSSELHPNDKTEIYKLKPL